MKTILILLSLATSSHAGAAVPLAEKALSQVTTAYAAELAARRIEVGLRYSDEDNQSTSAMELAPKGIRVIVYKKAAARHPLTTDHWLAIMCHEVGHILGGAPYIQTNPNDGGEISTEGQADYFAAAKCLKVLWAPEEKTQEALAKRIAVTHLSLFKLLHPEEKLGLDTPATERPEETLMSYGTYQCRVDTALAGALCTADPRAPFGWNNQRDGACTEGPGARPACWFRPYSLDRHYRDYN